MCVGEFQMLQQNKEEHRATSEPRTIGMSQDEFVLHLSSPSLLRVLKGKWNSSNGVEEKETWVEEDELFQGK